MKVVESHRTRHLVLRVERGEELPAAVLRVLGEAGVKAGWVQGFGTMEAVELAMFDQRTRSYTKARRIEPGGEAVSIQGNVSQIDGAGCLRLFATTGRETDVGLQVAAGEVLWGRAVSLELHVTVFDDVSMGRAMDERTGVMALEPSGGASPEARVRGEEVTAVSSRVASVPSVPQPSARSTRASDATMPSIVEMARAVMGLPEPPPQPLAPPRRERVRDELAEVYPEVGDMATHFHFGECKIISSDGDKIRLQQLKDLRVREVALSALKTELVSEDPETQKRHFRLLRKN